MQSQYLTDIGTTLEVLAMTAILVKYNKWPQYNQNLLTSRGIILSGKLNGIFFRFFYFCDIKQN